MNAAEGRTTIDELLDRAVKAINDGDRATATSLAGQVLSVDPDNPEAEDLLAFSPGGGEIRRLTTMFADLVDSTALSTQLDPEPYHTLVGTYRQMVIRIVERFGGHVNSIKGDGLFVLFGHPTVHENDLRRAITAGLEITAAVADLSRRAQRSFGVGIDVRVGIHRGPVYLDTDQHDVYGLAANLTARLSGLAQPGTVAVSDTVARLVGSWFDLDAHAPAPVKGVDSPIGYHLVIGERPDATALPSLSVIGRDRERQRLRECWQQAREGRLTTPGVVLCGEPGIGKTRLAGDAATVVRGAGAPVIELAGSALYSDVGFYPVRSLIERRCGITRQTGGAQRLRLLQAELQSLGMDAASTVPLLAPVIGIGPEHGYQRAVTEGPTLYQLIGATVRQYVLACIGDRAGLIVAEDVHWFDPSTSDLIESLLAGTDGRLLVIVTARDGLRPPDGWPAEVFELEPLTDEQSDALIEALYPGVSAAQRAAVRSRCDGVPFFVEHVVGELRSGNLDTHVPEALYEPLFARLHPNAEAVPVVEAAAVIGRSGDLALLRAVVGEHGERVEDIVTELTRTGVFEPVGTDGWRFRHELFREVAAELAPPSVQRELHGRAATALIDTASGVEPDWLVVARHYERAWLRSEAVDAYRSASATARRRGAASEAMACLTKALGQLELCAPGADRDREEIAIRLERGFLASATEGSWSGGGPADFERCLDLASTGNHQDELFTTLISLIGYYLPRAELRRAHELLDSLSDRVVRDRPWSSPVIASSLGSVVWLEGDFAGARAHLERALDDSVAAEPGVLDQAWWVAVDPIAAAHSFLALTSMICGDLASAEGALAESARRCDSLAFPRNAHNRAHTYFMEIWVRLESGQLDVAAELASRLRQQTTQSGLDLWRWVAGTERATVQALQALAVGTDAVTLRELAERLASRVDGSRQMHLNSYLTFHDAVIARVMIAAGCRDEARQRLTASLRHADDTGMHFHDAELLRLLAHTTDEHDERGHVLHAAWAVARSQDATLFKVRCLLDILALTRIDVRPALEAAVQRLGDARWPECDQARRALV